MEFTNFLSDIRKQRDEELLDVEKKDIHSGHQNTLTEEQLGSLEFQIKEFLGKDDTILLQQALNDMSILAVCKNSFIDNLEDEIINRIIELCSETNKRIAESALKVIYSIALKDSGYIQDLLDFDIYDALITNLPSIWACKIIFIFAKNNQNAQDLFISQNIHQYLLRLFLQFGMLPNIQHQLLLTMTAFTEHIEFDKESLDMLFPRLCELLESQERNSIEAGLKFLINCRNAEIIEEVINSDIVPNFMENLSRYFSKSYIQKPLYVISFLRQIATYKPDSAMLLIDSNLCGFIIKIKNYFEDKSDLINLAKEAIIYSPDHARSFITQEFVLFLKDCMLEHIASQRCSAISLICMCFQEFLMEEDIMEEISMTNFSENIENYLLENDNDIVIEVLNTLLLILKTAIKIDEEPPLYIKNVLDAIDSEEIRDIISELAGSIHDGISEAATQLIECIENYI